jgi:hypothetical protein
MVRMDPYTPTDSEYECVECHNRITTEDDFHGVCPGCGGEMKNIAVPRE